MRLPNSPAYTLLGLRSCSVRTVIDVGANCGQFAHYIRGIFPQARIYCFEPLPGPFQELSSWAEQQGQGEVTAFNFALGNRAGMTEMFFHVDHSPSSSLLESTDLNAREFPQTKRKEKVFVKLAILDDVYHELTAELEDDILIKLDVQGYEDRVIRGGKNIFERAKCCIVEVSLDSLYFSQANFKDICLMLDDLQFRYAGNLAQTYANDGRVIFFDAVFVKNE